MATHIFDLCDLCIVFKNFGNMAQVESPLSDVPVVQIVHSIKALLEYKV